MPAGVSQRSHLHQPQPHRRYIGFGVDQPLQGCSYLRQLLSAIPFGHATYRIKGQSCARKALLDQIQQRFYLGRFKVHQQPLSENQLRFGQPVGHIIHPARVEGRGADKAVAIALAVKVAAQLCDLRQI